MSTSYRVSGVLVRSDIALPAPPAGDETQPLGSLAFRTAPALPEAPPPGEAWEDRGHGVSMGRGREGFVLRLPGWADFWIARDGASVAGVPSEGCPEETLAQLFVDQVLPLVLHARGTFSFHAGAVALGGREVVAFLGRTGAGKSTLASSLARGADLLFADDCLAVEASSGGILAHPSYASTRLWPESAGALFSDRGPLPLCSPRTAKLRAALPAAAQPLPLRRLYLVETAEGAPSIAPIARRDALVRLAGHLYRLDAGDRARLAGEIDLLDRVVSAVPVAVLAYRRSYDDLPAVRRAVLLDCDRLTPEGPGG